ncbi:hypothetical protein LTR95_001726 [Oleoguttula sp. CCFEE 5521]
MKFTSLLRILAVQAIAPLLAAKALAQRDDLSQQYCSSQNTADNYAAVSNIYQSNGACFQQCLQDYAFAIVQYQQCWCSNYIPAEQLGTGSCDTPCPGYPDESCGNDNSGLFGYIPLRRQPSGTAGVASSTQASSTTPTPTPSSTSTTPVSTSTSTSYSSSTSDPPRSPLTAVVPSSSSTTRAASTTSSSAQVLTSTSSQTYTPPTTTSQEPASTTAAAQTTTVSTTLLHIVTTDADDLSSQTSTSSTTSAAPATTSSTTPSSSSTPAAAATTRSSTPTPATFSPSPVVSTRVVTLSGAVTTQTVTSTPAVFPAAAPAFTENERKSISGGAIAGIVIGVLLLLLLLILAIFFLRRRKRRESMSEIDAATTGAGVGVGRRSPRRNVSVLSKVGLLARNNTNSRHHQDMSENLFDDNMPATGQNSVRHSMLFNHGGSEGIAPVSPLAAGGYASSGHSYGQENSRRHSRPLVYDQRLNPSALWANAEANGSRVSIQDHADYSRSVGGRLGVVNPDTRSSFASSRG